MWLPVKGYEGLYSVNENGEVLSHSRKTGFIMRKDRVLKKNKLKNGYLHVYLCLNGVMKTALVHRLVALTFIPNPENKPQVNHKNGKIIQNQNQ